MKVDKNTDMGDQLEHENKTFISTSLAAELTGYSQDYIGQLARDGQIGSTKAGRQRFVDRDGLVAYAREHKNGFRLNHLPKEHRPEAVADEVAGNESVQQTTAADSSSTPTTVGGDSPRFGEAGGASESDSTASKTYSSFSEETIAAVKSGSQRVAARWRQTRDGLRPKAESLPATRVSKLPAIALALMVAVLVGVGGLQLAGVSMDSGAVATVEQPADSSSASASQLAGARAGQGLESDQGTLGTALAEAHYSASLAAAAVAGFGERVVRPIRNFFADTLYFGIAGLLEVGDVLTPDQELYTAPSIVYNPDTAETETPPTPGSAGSLTYITTTSSSNTSFTGGAALIQSVTRLAGMVASLADRIDSEPTSAVSAVVRTYVADQIDEVEDLARANVDSNLYDHPNTITLNGIEIEGSADINKLTVTATTSIDGSTFFVDASNNRVGIGTTTPEYGLDVAGDMRAGSFITAGSTTLATTTATNLTVSDDTTLGDNAASDTVTFNSRLLSDLAPATTSTYSLGSSALRFADGFFSSQLAVGGLTVSTSSITSASGAISFDDENLSTAGSFSAATTTLATTTISDLSATSAAIVSAAITDLVTENASTTNATTTNSYIRELLVDNSTTTNAFISALVATDAVFANSTTTNATTTNAFIQELVATNSTTTNAYIATLTADDIIATNATTTDAYITNLLADNSTTTNALITSLTATDSVFTNSTTTNSYVQSLLADAGTITDLEGTNATITSATTTNFFASVANFTTAFFDTLTATVANITNLDVENATSTNFATTDLTATGTVSLATSTIDAVTVGGDTINDFTGQGLSVANNVLGIDDVETLNTSLTAGSVVFSDGSTLAEDNTNFFWDDANNRLGLGTDNPSEMLELGEDGRLKLSTALSNLDDSSLIRLQWTATTGKPAIGWFDENNDRQAAIVAHYGSSLHDNVHQHLSFETADSLGALQTRLDIDWGKDQSEIKVSSADFKIGAGNDFILGSAAGTSSTATLYGDLFGYGLNNLGFGDKDWAADGLETGAKWEFYRSSSDAELLIHAADLAAEANLHLKTGTRDWEIVNEGTDLLFQVEGVTELTIDDLGGIITDTVNTGQGNNELYAMDQDVRTGDDVTFASVNTASGTITNLTAETATITSATTTNFFASVANFTTAIVNNLTATVATITDLTVTNSTTTNATTTNSYITNLDADAANITDLVATNSTTTDAYITDLLADNSTTTNAFITSLIATDAEFTNASTTNATTTNSYIRELLADNSTTTNAFITSLVATDAEFTNSTTTDAYITDLLADNSTTTNAYIASLVADSVNVTDLTATNSTTTNAYITNLVGDDATLTNLEGTNATITNATTTNFFASVANFTTAVVTNLTASVATITDLVATNATTTNLVATDATTTNLTASGTTGLATTTATDLTVSGDTSLQADLSVAGTTTARSIIPAADDTYDLGSSAARWRDLYLGPDSLHIGSAVSEANLSYTTASHLLAFQNTSDSTTGFQFLDADGGTPILNIDTTNERIGIGTNSPTAALSVAGAVTANTLDTGQGVNELYAMDQNVQTSDTVEFGGLTIGLDTVTDLTGSNLVISSGALSVDDGAGSGLDADTIDTLDSTQFLRSDASSTLSAGTLTLAAGTTLNVDGDADFSGNLVISDDGQLVATADSQGTGIGQGTVYVNPGVAGVNNVLLGLAVNGSERIRFDAEGDIQFTGLLNSTQTSGTNQLSGSLRVDSDATFGTTASDTVSLNARLQGDIIPTADVTYNLGSENFRFANFYAATTTIDNLVTGGTASSTFTINAQNNSADTEDATLAFSRGNVTPDATLRWNSNSDQFEFNDFLVSFANNINVQGTASSTFSGPVWLTGTSGGTTGSDSVLYINPPSGATNNSLFTVAVNNAERFSIDAEGDVSAHASLGIENTLFDISNTVLTIDDDLKIMGNDIQDSSGTSRVTLGSTNTVTGNLTVTGNTDVQGTLDAPTLNTGQGDNELYAMDQSVRTTDGVTFASVDADTFTTDSLVATTGSFTNLEGTNATITNATTTNFFASVANFTTAVITNLTASVASITDLVATNATTTNLVATNATIDSVTTGADTITDFTGTGLSVSANVLAVDQSALDVEGFSTSLTSGSIAFSDGSNLTQDNSNLFWDDANNRLGIGTPSPDATLEVVGGDFYLRDNGSDPRIVIGDSTSGGDWGGIRWNSTLDAVQLGTSAGGYNFTLTEAGEIGIGTTSPASKLDVYGTDSGESAVFSNYGAAGIRIWSDRDSSANQESYVSFGDGNSAGSPEASWYFGQSATRNLTLGYTTGAWGNPGVNDQVTITPSGQVGIGEASPGEKLVVEGSDADTTQTTAGVNLAITNTDTTVGNYSSIVFGHNGGNVNSHTRIGAIFQDRTGGSEDTDLFFGTLGGGTYSEKVRIKSTGEVGIGTTSPATELQVIGTTTLDMLSIGGYLINDFTGTGLSVSANVLAVDQAALDVEGFSTSLTAGSVAFSDGSNLAQDNSNLFWDDANNRLGIGTDSPERDFEVNNSGDSQVIIRAGDTMDSVLNFGDQTSYNVGRIRYDHNINAMWFNTNSNERLRIDSSGNVGIGTSSPATKLQVSGSGSTNKGILNLSGGGTFGPALTWDNTSTGGASFFMVPTDDSWGAGGNKFVLGHGGTASGNIDVTIDGTGNVGIGTTSPDNTLTVEGTAKIYGTTGNLAISRASGSNVSLLSLLSGNTPQALFQVNADNPNTEIDIVSRNGYNLNLGYESSPIVTLTTGQDVGIGTTSPATELQVVGTTTLDMLSIGGDLLNDFTGQGLSVANNVLNVDEVETLSSSLSAGSVVFSGGTSLTEDADNLFWNNTYKRLGIGTNVTSATLDVVGTGEFSDTVSFSGDIFGYNTKAVGFGDKDWAASGLETGAKWEFYRDTTNAQLLVHANDPTDEANLHLRVGTRDWNIYNDSSDLMIDGEGATKLSILETGEVGIGTTSPAVALAIDATDALLLPVGTTGERPSGATGYIRYNTTTAQFEGYSSGAWQGLGGVIDIDQDTYIEAEETSDEDYLRFYTAGTERLYITNGGSIIGNATGTAAADFIFGSAQTGDVGTAAQDNRFFFDKSKAAFRAGDVSGSQWDDANVGTSSVAFGRDTTASGNYSTALGFGATANDTASFATGWFNTASGYVSTAFGDGTTAAGAYSTAFGEDIEAFGDYSFAVALDGNQSGVSVPANTAAFVGGSVGIGTSTPATTLDVAGTTTAQAFAVGGDTINDFTGTGLSVSANVLAVDQSALDVEGFSTSLTAGSIAFSDGSNLTQDNSNLFWDDANDRLGIGTANPDAKLDIAGSAYINGVLRSRNIVPSSPENDFESFINVGSYSGGSTIRTGTLVVELPQYNHDMVKIRISGWSYNNAWDVVVGGYAKSGSDQWASVSDVIVSGDPPFDPEDIRLTADSAGEKFYVFIGTESVSWNNYLHVRLDVDSFYALDDNLADGWDIYVAGTEPSVTNTVSPAVSFYGGSEAFISGNVGIGTTSPANTLDVAGGIDATTLNTGQGDNELYAMDQNMRTTDSATFAGMTLSSDLAMGGNNIDNVGNIDFGSSTGDKAHWYGTTYTTGIESGTLYWEAGSRFRWYDGAADGGVSDIAELNSSGLTVAAVNTGQGANELYAMNQNVRTSDSPTFSGLTSSGSVDFGSAFVSLPNAAWRDLSGNPWITPSDGTQLRIGPSGSTETFSMLINRITDFEVQSSATFGGSLTADTLNTGQGDNELYAMDQAVRTSDGPTFSGLTSTGDIDMNANTITDVGQLDFTSGESISDGTNLTISSNSGHIDLRPSDGTHGIIIRDFDGSSTAWAGLRTQDDGELQIGTDTAGYEQLVLKDDGRIGVGTSNFSTVADGLGNGAWIEMDIQRKSSEDVMAGLLLTGGDYGGYFNMNTGSGDGMLSLSVDSLSSSFWANEDSVGYYSGNTSWSSLSDRRLKENITEIPTALSKIEQLGGYYFTWKEDPEKIRQVGFIAQEVEKVLPEVVDVNTDTGMKSVQYSMTVPLLVQAINEQQEAIAEQAQQLAANRFWAEEMNGEKPANNFLAAVRVALEDFMGDVSARFKEVTADKVVAEKELCLGDTCVTEPELQELLTNRAATENDSSSGMDSLEPREEDDGTSTDDDQTTDTSTTRASTDSDTTDPAPTSSDPVEESEEAQETSDSGEAGTTTTSTSEFGETSTSTTTDSDMITETEDGTSETTTDSDTTSSDPVEGSDETQEAGEDEETSNESTDSTSSSLDSDEAGTASSTSSE